MRISGVATAVVYGVMLLVASLPGAVFLVLAWFRRTRHPHQLEPLPSWQVAAVAQPDGVPRA